MSGVMGGQISTTSWGWHDVSLSNEPERLELVWVVTDSRGVEAGTEDTHKEYYVIVPGVTDAREAWLFICRIGEEGLPDQDA